MIIMRLVRRIFEINLKHFREAKGWSQSELSERCGYDRTYVSKIEKGDRMPTLPVIYELSSALEIKLQEFFKLNQPECYQEVIEQLHQHEDKGKEFQRNFLRKHVRPFNWSIDACVLIDGSGWINKEIMLFPEKLREIFEHDSVCHCANSQCDKKLWDAPFWENVRPKRNKIRPITENLIQAKEPVSSRFEFTPVNHLDRRLDLKFVTVSLNETRNLFVGFAYH